MVPSVSSRSLEPSIRNSTSESLCPRYRDNFALWVGSGEHFAFINQPAAGFANFKSLATAVNELMDDDGSRQIQTLLKQYMKDAQVALNDVWRRKLGFAEWSEAHQQVWEELHELMQVHSPDYTIMWRQLAYLCDDPEARSDPAKAFAYLEPGFYKEPSSADRAGWVAWIEHWLELLERDSQDTNARVKMMKSASPKYVPREWMLKEVYDAAYKGDLGPLHQLHQVLTHPYEELPEMHDIYYRKCPAEMLKQGGIAHMT